MTKARNPSRLLVALGALIATTGCLDEQRFVTPDTGGPWVWAIDRDTPPYFASEDGNVYLVEQRIEIPFREPTDEEQAALGDIGDMQIPYARLPYVRRGDIELQLDFTLSSIEVGEDADPLLVTVVVNGFNEFHEYNPGVQVIDDELIVDYAQWERTFELQPGARARWTVREEELDEVAVDLATVVNGAPNANQIVYFENQSANDPRSLLYIPDAIPGLTGVRVGLRSLGEDDDGALPVVIEATLRVRDVRDILVQGDDDPWPAPAPALFGPADAMAAAPPAP